mgnify:FL=1
MLENVFKEKSAFIPFIMAGHPTVEATEQAILALSEAGASLIELGVPFSDPVADGPVNQRAAEIALNNGMNLGRILAIVKSIRQQGCQTPIVLFSYFNPILAYGETDFAIDAKASGVDGVLIVDLPPEEGETFYNQLQSKGLAVVLLISPTTNPNRFEVYRRVNPAFIYYISRLAVTGAQKALSPELANELNRLRTYFPKHPIAVGFGISTLAQAETVAQLADGVVIGSCLVDMMEKEGLNALEMQAKQFVATIQSRYPNGDR